MRHSRKRTGNKLRDWNQRPKVTVHSKITHMRIEWRRTKALRSGQFWLISLIRAVRTSIGYDEDEWHTISASVTANARWQ